MGGGRSNFRSLIDSICSCGESARGTFGHRNGPESMSAPKVQLQIQERHVLISNGIVLVTLSKPGGIVTAISYNGIDNLLEFCNKESNRGYWDIVWSSLDGTGKKGVFEVFEGTHFRVIKETEEQVEVSFSRPWDPSLQGKLVPLNIDKRFILLRGSSGFYTYAIYEHVGSQDWPAFSIGETRIAFKLRKDKFPYMAVADDRKRLMPLPDDRMPGRSQALAYAEAALLVNPLNPQLTGEVFLSGHYAGDDLAPKIRQAEPWKKVFGPIFIYLNSVMPGYDPLLLWEDAKRQMVVEVQSWPYSFPASEDFPSSDQRGSVCGTLLVKDRFVNDNFIPATGAYVGLAPLGGIGSWQRECKDYQFWTMADENGSFLIKNARVGDYNLYAWVPGFIGDFRNNDVVTICPGCHINLADLVFEPPRDGPTLWEIGIPDRSAAEFYVPEPNPKHINRLFVNHPDRFRQYGLWERYAEIYPDGDLVYTVGLSDYKIDWFFAQVTRRMDDNTFRGTTWQIKFKLGNIKSSGTYKLRVALASATLAELQVRVNDPNTRRPLFSSGLIGRDNAVARHGIHGLYWLYHINIPGNVLVQGDNTIFFTQPRNQSPWQNLMYDYIRLEAPST